MISLEDLEPPNHNYRKLKSIWNFKYVNSKLKCLEKDNPDKEYGLDRAVVRVLAINDETEATDILGCLTTACHTLNQDC